MRYHNLLFAYGYQKKAMEELQAVAVEPWTAASPSASQGNAGPRLMTNASFHVTTSMLVCACPSSLLLRQAQLRLPDEHQQLTHTA